MAGTQSYDIPSSRRNKTRVLGEMLLSMCDTDVVVFQSAFDAQVCVESLGVEWVVAV